MTVRAGNDAPAWLVRGTGVAVELCTCRQAVYTSSGTTPLLGPLDVTETVTDGGVTWFAVRLSPAQTAALNTTRSKKGLRWVSEIIGGVSVTPAYNREVHRQLNVLPQNLP